MGHRIDPSWGGSIELFLFKPVLHNWFNKGCGMYYPVCGKVYLKEPLLLIRYTSYFSFQPVFRDWFNYPVSGMVHIKELLLIGKSSPCDGSWFLLSLSVSSLAI